MQVEPLVYTIQDIKILRRCGKDKAYKIAKSLPHYIEGNQTLVFKKDFDEDFERIRKQAMSKEIEENQIYRIRKLK